MKCKICESSIQTDEMVHEVPNQYSEMIILCDDCYESIYNKLEEI